MRTAEEFERVYQQLMSDWLEGRSTFMGAMSRLYTAEITDYATEIRRMGNLDYEVIVTPNEQRIFHTLNCPAQGSSGVLYYYLFDYSIDQGNWFLLTGKSEEEQLAHILKWGRQ